MPGINWRAADACHAFERYLVRNPGLSFVARYESQLVGYVVCGHDGRRGYLQHLAVDPAYRQGGIGRQLVQRCLEAVTQLGIEKVHLDVLMKIKRLSVLGIPRLEPTRRPAALLLDQLRRS